MKKHIVFSFISILCLHANDIYSITYTEDTNCSATKNGTSIDLFDKRFKKEPPRSSYTCSLIQKEQYRECRIKEKQNLSALYFGYGSYEYTNLIAAFKSPHKSIKSSLVIECTKHDTFQ